MSLFPLLRLPDVVLADILRRCPAGSIAGFHLPLALEQVRLLGTIDPHWLNQLLRACEKFPKLWEHIGRYFVEMNVFGSDTSIEYSNFEMPSAIEFNLHFMKRLRKLNVSSHHRYHFPVLQLPSSLTEVKLSGCFLSEEEALHLQQCSELHTLCIGGGFLPCLFSLRRLEVESGSCKLKGLSNYVPFLESLTIGNCSQISGLHGSELPATLQTVWIKNNLGDKWDLTLQQTLDVLGKLQHLKTLRIPTEQFTRFTCNGDRENEPMFITSINKMPALSIIRIRDLLPIDIINKLHDSIILEVEVLQENELSCIRNSVRIPSDGAELVTLPGHKRGFKFPFGFDELSIQRIIHADEMKSLSGLKSCTVYGGYVYEESNIRTSKMCKKLPSSLQYLKFFTCSWFNDKDSIIHDTIGHLQQLQSLYLSCHGLKSICIPFMRNLTHLVLVDAELGNFEAATLPCVRSLRFANCIEFSDTTIESIISSFPSLRYLSLINCVSDFMLSKYVFLQFTTLPYLEWLTISYNLTSTECLEPLLHKIRLYVYFYEENMDSVPTVWRMFEKKHEGRVILDDDFYMDNYTAEM